MSTPSALAIELAWTTAGGLAILGLVRWWRHEMSFLRGGIYLGVVLLFFAPAFAHGGFQLATDLASRWLPWRETVPPVAPENPLLADPVLEMLPLRTVLRQRLLRGEAPLWIDELGTGQPLLGNPLWMPFFVLTVGLPPLQALTVAAVWQSFIALLLTHLLLRRLGASQAGASLAAVAFGFSTFATAWLYYPLWATACWLPGVLLGLLLVRDRARGGAGGLVVCVCGMALGGHPETLAHGALAALAVGVWLVVTAPAQRWLLLGRMSAAAVLAACLTAPAWLPTIVLIRDSERWAQLAARPDAVAPPALAPRTLALLVDPLACGSPRDGNWSGAGNFNEMATAYCGLVVLSLAGAGALALRRQVAAIAFGGAAALAIALRCAPFEMLLVPFGIFQHAANGRMRYLWVLAVAVAAGLTIDRLTIDHVLRRTALAMIAAVGALLTALPPPAGAPWQRWWWLSTLAGLVLALVVLAVPRARRCIGPVVCAVTLADLALSGARFNPTPGDAFTLAPPPALTGMIREVRPDSPPPRVAALGWDLMPNLALLYGLADPRGNDPTRPAAAARFVGERLGGRYEPGAQVRLPERWLDQGALDYLGVRFLITRHRRELPAPWRLNFDGPGGRVWENPGAMARFFLPRRCEEAHGPGKALASALVTRDFRELAVVEAGGGCAPSQVGEVTSIRRDATGYRLDVSTGSGGMVASSVSYAPGWIATVNGQRRIVGRINGAFLGFTVPPGRSEVRLRYEPFAASVGYLLAAGAWLSLIVRAWRRRVEVRSMKPRGWPHGRAAAP